MFFTPRYAPESSRPLSGIERSKLEKDKQCIMEPRPSPVDTDPRPQTPLLIPYTRGMSLGRMRLIDNPTDLPLGNRKLLPHMIHKALAPVGT